MTTHINAERALELLREARDLKGSGYTVRSCEIAVWGKNGYEGSCIVGVAFELAVGRENFFTQSEEHEYMPTIGGTVTLPAKELGIVLTDAAKMVFSFAQFLQDGDGVNTGAWGSVYGQTEIFYSEYISGVLADG